MKWYSIKKEYIDYLKLFDKSVPNVEYDKRVKPFIGTLFKSLNGVNYFCPISSYKPKFSAMDDMIDFIKIVDNNENKILSAVCLNYMIPVPKTEAYEITYRNIDHVREFNSITEKRMYWRLLNKEMLYIEKKKDLILANAEKLYHICSIAPDHPLAHRCLNFPKLEKQCLVFERNKAMKLYPAEEMNKYLAEKYLSSVGKCMCEFNNKLYIINKEHANLGLSELDYYYGEAFFDAEYENYAHFLYREHSEICISCNKATADFCLSKQELNYLNIRTKFTEQKSIEKTTEIEEDIEL